MIGRWRERRACHALGHDAGRTDKLRPSVGQVLLTIGPIKLRLVLRDGIENEQMSCHGIFLSFWVAFTKGI
jgi:hypothetical protein